MRTITNSTLRERRRLERGLKDEASGLGVELGHLWRAVAPWLLLVTALAGAPLAYLLAALAEVQAFAASCIAISGVILIVVSLHLTKGRLTLGRIHELFNVSAPVALIAFTVQWGLNKYMLLGAGIFGTTSAIIWNRRHTSSTMRELERTANGRGAAYGNIPERWKQFVAQHAPDLADSSMTVIKDDKDELAAGIDLGEAGIPSDVGGFLDRITRFGGGIAGGTSLQPGERLDQVMVRVMRRDPLKKPPAWRGPSGPGESIVEAIEGLGLYRDKAGLALTLPYVAPKRKGEQAKQQSHLAIIGTSRAGKGAAGELIDCNVALRSDAIVVFCDAVKADQSVGPISQGAAYVLDTPSKIRAFLHRLVNYTIPARSAYLGNPTKNKLGKVLREWVPGCGLSWVLVHVAEAGALYNNQHLTQASERAASVGIMLVIEAQKGIHDRVDVNARSNMSALLCFGTWDYDDAVLVLPRELLDLGVDPSAWRNKQPGTCYVCFPEFPITRQAMPARFCQHADDGSDVAAALAEYSHLTTPCDPITAATWGEPFQKYRAALDARLERQPRQHSFAGAVLLDEPAPAPRVIRVSPLEKDGLREARPEEPEGFDLEPRVPAREASGPDDEQEAMTADEAYRELVDAAEHVVLGMTNALGDDPEANAVLQLAREGLARYADEEEPGGQLYVPRPDDIDFPDDPDLEPIPSRDEAIDVVLDILHNEIGEGHTFKPSRLYDDLERRAKRGDSWVRHLMKPLQEWGCIRETDEFGVYEVIHTRRGDAIDTDSNEEDEA